jgi:hypothetical protein
MLSDKGFREMKARFNHSSLLRLLSLLIFSLIPTSVLAQETSTCAENLKTAQSLFDKGQVEKVPSILYNCMKSGFKREEQLAAYKLLIQSYLLEDKLVQADSAMLTFLKRYPEYQLSPTDHSSFVFLFNSFKVTPLIQITFHIGTNMPFLTNVVPRSVSSEPANSQYSASALNLFASLEAKFQLYRHLEVNIEGGYSQVSFTNKEDFLGMGVTTYTETQHRIEVPVSLTYNIISLGKFTPYIRAGAGTALDLSSSAKVVFESTEKNSFENIEGPDIVRNDSRVFADIFAQAGLGLKFKTPRGFINLEARSNFGFLNQTSRAGNSTEQLKWDYKYKDDYFNLNTLNITLGYTQIFYKSSKRK